MGRKTGNLRNRFVVLLLVLIVVAVFFASRWDEKQSMSNKSVEFIFLDANRPNSFDPLDADRALNLNAMRLLYATPVEVSLNNELTSSILESFKYNTDHREIHFKLKAGVKFSDGNPLSPEDVALAIARMAWKRPGFPVIKDIVGLQEWLKEDRPLLRLPAGISIENSSVKVKLSRTQRSPLFRFTLELFSVIPKKSVDLKTGKLKDAIPAFSGLYMLSLNSDTELLFKKRHLESLDSSGMAVDQIKFLYAKGDKAFAEEKLKGLNTVLYGSDVQLISLEMTKLVESTNIKWLPSSRFNFVLLNPNIAPFHDVACRHYFMRAYRQVLKGIYGDTLALSPSIFSKIVPGYLTDEQLTVNADMNLDSICVEKFKNAKMSMYALSADLKDMNDKILYQTLSTLGAQIDLRTIDGVGQREAMFAKGLNPVLTAGSGFWAEDPLGDVKMFFTPNLHEPLKYVLKNKNLLQMLEQMDEESLDITDDLKMINRALNADALLNVVFHSKRFFATKNKSLLKELPQAVSSPAFWQIINVE